MPRELVQRLGRDLRWGLAWGISGGLGTCLFTWLVSIIDRPGFATVLGENAITLGRLMVAYVAAGLAGGLTLALVRPLTRRPLGAVVAGVLVAFVVYTALFSIFEASPRLVMETPGTVLMAATVVGSIAGLGLWKFFQDFEWLPGAKDRPDGRRTGA